MKLKNKKTNYLLVGNPNVGKTTFFNHLTTSVASVGNFDRTTVNSKVGSLKKDKNTKINDLPGIYNLNSLGDDDKVVLKTLFNFDYNGIINVTNANTFLRDMYLTLQLLESQQPVVIALNMIDELKNKEIDVNKLKVKLNSPVVLTNAKKDLGLNEVKTQLNCPLNSFKLKYSDEVEEKINKISSLIENNKLPKRFYAIQALEKNEFALNYINETQENNEEILKIINSDEGSEKQIYESKFNFIKELYLEVFQEKLGEIISRKNNFEKLDKVLLRKITALPIFFLVLALIYYITFGPYTGGKLNELIDEGLNDKLLNIIYEALEKTKSPEFLNGFICNAVLGGIFAVMPFLPFILILFIFIGLLQQSGYLSRVSAVTDEILSPFGLTGRSVIGLISGMGCNVPTIMMARASQSKKEKVISILIAPFISCSARTVVYSFVASLIFVNNVWLVILLLQIFSGFTALIIGLLFSQTMFRKRKNVFFIELPKWRSPDFKTIGKMIWFEVKNFLIRVGKFVFVGSVIVWTISHIGPKGFLNDEQIEKSFMGYIGKGFGYLLWPIGLSDWRVAASLLLAFPAKEIAVTNMLIVFNGIENIHAYFNLAIALSYLVFFALYIPCLSTMAVIKSESNYKNLFISIGISLLTAYIFSLFVYWVAFSLT
ncbi:ferrous iron transport protein B [Spiroplasma chinense]|uniref:Ferrous iron transport protein B n=1 Tax=Spiroplasma chinense TaxID=216932 RepID=A0A5B9Y425_9MOLU|nr:ferrous iron transport protein B [Spiroplasma chinense]QEH61824.1 ferrous iron transport protein B [Spiroplasma chinense]